jgi:hypothetical protein
MPKEAPAEREVVRYANRKLYDLGERRYVTLEELGAMVAGGADVTVREQRTGKDISSLVLGQALVDTLKRRTSTLPKRILQRIITLAASAHESPRPGPDAAARVAKEAERIAADLIARGRLGLEDAAALRASIVDAASRAVSDAQRSVERRLGDLLARSEREFGVTPSLTTLKERLVTLETSLDRPRRRPAGARRNRK